MAEAGGVSERARRECRALARHLVSHEPDAAIIRAYARGLDSASFRAAPPPTPLDGVLLAVARVGPRCAGLADAYARGFAPTGLLRRRLILLLAILESTSPGHHSFEARETTRMRAVLGVLGSAVAFALRLLLAILLIGPVHAAASVYGRLHRRAPPARPETAP